MKKVVRALGGVAAALSVGAVLAVAGAAPASAANRDGVCHASAYTLDPVGEFCFYYNSGLKGSRFDSRFSVGNINNLAGYEFLTPDLAGYGVPVKNNAASAWNRFSGESVYVFFNSGFQGPSDFVGSMTSKQLVNTYNENASYRWVE